MSAMKYRILLLLTLFLVGCSQQAPEYEFHTGGDGLILWRCNRRTGEVDQTHANRPGWQRVTTSQQAHETSMPAR